MPGLLGTTSKLWGESQGNQRDHCRRRGSTGRSKPWRARESATILDMASTIGLLKVQRSAVSGQRSAVSGQWSVVSVRCSCSAIQPVNQTDVFPSIRFYCSGWSRSPEGRGRENGRRTSLKFLFTGDAGSPLARCLPAGLASIRVSFLHPRKPTSFPRGRLF